MNHVCDVGLGSTRWHGGEWILGGRGVSVLVLESKKSFGGAGTSCCIQIGTVKDIQGIIRGSGHTKRSACTKVRPQVPLRHAEVHQYQSPMENRPIEVVDINNSEMKFSSVKS